MPRFRQWCRHTNKTSRAKPPTAPSRSGTPAGRQRSACLGAERFDVGLLAITDWDASWLQVPDGALARSTFTLPKPAIRARLYLGAQGVVEPRVNGKVVEPTRFLDNSATDFTQRVVPLLPGTPVAR